MKVGHRSKIDLLARFLLSWMIESVALLTVIVLGWFTCSCINLFPLLYFDITALLDPIPLQRRWCETELEDELI